MKVTKRKITIAKRRSPLAGIVICVCFAVVAIAAASFIENSTTKDTGTDVGSKNDINQQLADANNKINQLPDLEKDIFSKCMEKSNKTALDIKNCQTNTQEEIFTLAQELQNLKKDLESKK